MKGQNWPLSDTENIVKISRYFLNIAISRYFQMMQYIAFAIYRDTKRSPLDSSTYGTKVHRRLTQIPSSTTLTSSVSIQHPLSSQPVTHNATHWADSTMPLIGQILQIIHLAGPSCSITCCLFRR